MTDNYPTNDADTLYIRGGYEHITLSDLHERIKNHFKTGELDAFTIELEYIHTRCITYDLYDAGDWDTYLIIRRPQ